MTTDNPTISNTTNSKLRPIFGYLSYDYHETAEYKNEMFQQHLIFLSFYLIIIPIFLFLISRLLRCLRHHGIISIGSEQCMMDECHRRVTRVTRGRNMSIYPNDISASESGGSSESSPYSRVLSSRIPLEGVRTNLADSIKIDMPVVRDSPTVRPAN